MVGAQIQNTRTPGPHSDILIMGGRGGGGGGATEVNILYPKKSQLQNLSAQKITMYISSIPKKPTPT